MRCMAVIEAQRPGLDSVLIWDRNGELVAFAYQDGKVTMTRPLTAQDTLENATTEALTAFQVTDGRMTPVADWANAVPVRSSAGQRARW